MAAGPVPPLDAAALDGLRALFDAFDDDRDGLLEPAELGAILAAAGVTLSESEVLDLVTEVKPTLRKLVSASQSVPGNGGGRRVGGGGMATAELDADPGVSDG